MDKSILKGHDDAQYWLVPMGSLTDAMFKNGMPTPPHVVVEFGTADANTVTQVLKQLEGQLPGPGLLVAITTAATMAQIEDYNTDAGLEVLVRPSEAEAEDAVFLYSLEQNFGSEDDDDDEMLA